MAICVFFALLVALPDAVIVPLGFTENDMWNFDCILLTDQTAAAIRQYSLIQLLLISVFFNMSKYQRKEEGDYCNTSTNTGFISSWSFANINFISNTKYQSMLQQWGRNIIYFCRCMYLCISQYLLMTNARHNDRALFSSVIMPKSNQE